MPRSLLFRSLAPTLAALVLAACADSVPTGLPAPSQAVNEQGPGSDSGSLLNAGELELRAIWWSQNHKLVSVSKTIDASGGTISIPATGFSMSFPAGAVSGPIKITVTADEKYVAYKMEPAGTQFAKDVTVTQLLKGTELYGRPLRAQLFAAYIADDNLQLSGNVPVLEIEPSRTIFSPLSPLFPEAHVWIIRHFSRYMLASG